MEYVSTQWLQIYNNWPMVAEIEKTSISFYFIPKAHYKLVYFKSVWVGYLSSFSKWLLCKYFDWPNWKFLPDLLKLFFYILQCLLAIGAHKLLSTFMAQLTFV